MDNQSNILYLKYESDTTGVYLVVGLSRAVSRADKNHITVVNQDVQNLIDFHTLKNEYFSKLPKKLNYIR